MSGDGLYEYDPLYRLLKATGREHPATQPIDTDPQLGTGLPHANDLQALIAYRETYVYDAVGNIEHMAHVAGPSGSLGWTRNYEYATDSNRLLKTSVPGSPLNLSESYTYDEHGSMTTMTHLAAMDWDYADRLQHTQKGAGSGAQHTYLTYDGGGQRVRKVAVASGNVKERIYLGGYELYRERADAPGATTDFERQTLHVMDDQRRVAMAETKTREAGAAVPILTTRWRFQLDNHLGSASLELDAGGAVISYEEFHPYGTTAFRTADGAAQISAKRYRYTGKEKDEETGLYYHGARYYAPWLARWTAADPIGIRGGLNLYEYARDNPILFSDPGGTQPFAKPGTADYKIGTSKDPELVGYLKSLSAEERGQFVGSATGKFQQRAQAALRSAHLGSVVSVPEVTVEGTPPGVPVLPAREDPDPIVAGSAGGVNYLNIRQSQLTELQQQARVNRSLQTLGNVANGILGAIGYLVGKASSDDPDIQGAASDIGALGDSALHAVGTVQQLQVRPNTATAEPARAVATGRQNPTLDQSRSDLLRVFNQRGRTLELSNDPSGRKVNEGIGGLRIEQATGETLSRPPDPAFDFASRRFGRIDIKGPLREAASGAPIPITDAMVRGMGKAAIKEANLSSGSDVVFVDTLGLSDPQVKLLLDVVSAGQPKKPIYYLR